MTSLICGIDYGSKLAGTTVLAAGNLSSKIVSFHESKPRQDADAFLWKTIAYLQPGLVGIDAPLSLPGVYTGLSGCSDYFYRIADKSLQAMSPMFLGGLTARAMQLTSRLKQSGITVLETYPSAQAQRMHLRDSGYKKSVPAIGEVLEKIRILFSEWQFTGCTTWHHVDALLALLAMYRFTQGIHERFGSEPEGLIVI